MSFWSKTLGRFLKFRATTHALRCIDKAGGIDHWLMRSSNDLINNPKAIKLKKKITKLWQPASDVPASTMIRPPRGWRAAESEAA